MTRARTWQREAVVYQIYPRSFNDADGDGVGDLRGVAEKADYVDDLGADVVWLNPVYDSPQVDNGYDVRDYRSIDPTYGTLADWEALRDALHAREVKLVMDLPLNHTSDEHEWFRRSRRGEAPYDDYYVWEAGDPDDPPNNWESLFGGSGWTYDDERGAWYLHLFHERMPDLEWRNPMVREEIYDVVDWWHDRGADGFRLDVVNLLSKTAGLPDGDPASAITGSEHFVNGPEIHEFVAELVDRAFDDEHLSVGETLDVTPADARRFVVEDGLDMVFPFEHMDIDVGGGGPWDVVDWDLAELEVLTERWQTALDGGWIGLYLSNHDQPRLVSRFGDEAHRVESATLYATYLFTLRGTPFVYQGQEIGMTNPTFESLDEFRDPATVDRIERALETGDVEAFAEVREVANYWSRDNARTAMQWADEPNAGFTTGEPWIKVAENYPTVNVEREAARPDSVLAYYRRLATLRDEHPVLVYGEYDPLLEDHPEVFAYRRALDDAADWTDERADAADALVVLHFDDGEGSVALPDEVAQSGGDLLIANYDGVAESLPATLDLRPYEARVYRLSEAG